MFIYTTFKCDILTPGHIKILEELHKEGFVIVGLLTDDALIKEGKPAMPYKDRKYILETVAKSIGNVMVVEQTTLDPIYNLEFYECRSIATGDEFNDYENKAIKDLKLEPLHIKFKSEKDKRYSSSKLKERIIRQNKGSR